MIQEKQNQEYFQFIDLFRFLAIFISFLHHSNVIYFIYGHTFFFVLSGFILTFHANNERKRHDEFNWLNFTLRRILRIFPLYFLIVLTCYFILPLIYKGQITLPPILYYLSFTSNYYSENHAFVLMILWSVAVQEQFYLFISLCFKFLSSKLIYVGITMIIITICFKIVAEIYDMNIYFHTLNHFTSFGIGIILAKIYQFRMLLKTKQAEIIVILLSCITLLFFVSNFNTMVWKILENTLVSLIFAFILWYFLSLNKFNFKSIFFKVLQKFGQFSYGMYCFQGLVITLGNFILSVYLPQSNPLLIVVINFLILILVSFISYRIFETRFLKLKMFFRS